MGATSIVSATAESAATRLRHRSASLWSLAAASSLVASVACGGSSAGPSNGTTQVLTSIAVSINVDTLRLKQAAQATAEGRDQAGAPMALPDPTWSTGSSTVATVSVSGVVTAVGLGLTTIIATVGGKQGQVPVHVVPNPVEAVSVIPSTVTLAPGTTRQLAALVIDAAGTPLTDRNVAWLSSDTARATVSDDGVVTAISPGIVSISALSEGVYASADIRVSGPPGPVATVTLSPPAASIAIGQVLQVATTLEDAVGNVATDRPVTFSSTSPGVAVVSASGLVTAIDAGTAVIEAVSEGQRGTATVIVVDPLDAITVRFADPVPDEIVGDTLTIVASANGRNTIVRAHAILFNKEADLKLTLVGARRTGLAWAGTLDLSDIRFGPYQLVVTAFDDRGNKGIGTIAIKRGTREGSGGATLPPRNK